MKSEATMKGSDRARPHDSCWGFGLHSEGGRKLRWVQMRTTLSDMV